METKQKKWGENGIAQYIDISVTIGGGAAVLEDARSWILVGCERREIEWGQVDRG